MKLRAPQDLIFKPLPAFRKKWGLPFLLPLLFLLLLAAPASAQIVAPVPTAPDPGDTVSVEPVKFKFVPYREWSKPARAAFYAAILPGAGQAYNRKYWKMPILYGGMAVIGYFIRYNNDLYHRFKRAYVLRTDGDPTTIDEFNIRYRDAQTLLTGTNIYHRRRDLSVILMVGAHAIGILDAHVDAHLKEFDISEDLSFKVKPQLLPVFGSQVAPSVTLKLNLNGK